MKLAAIQTKVYTKLNKTKQINKQQLKLAALHQRTIRLTIPITTKDSVEMGNRIRTTSPNSYFHFSIYSSQYPFFRRNRTLA